MSENEDNTESRPDDSKGDGDSDSSRSRSRSSSPELSDSDVPKQDQDDQVGLQSLKNSLQEINIECIEKPPERSFIPDRFPPSYKDNNPKEMIAIRYCTTFLKQYNHLYFDRRPVFLRPENEFGVEKLVCTTINPTQLPYSELMDWENIASFVAGYLNYDPLTPAHMLPRTLYAPQTVMECRRGHCFEYSTLLCSMLIGSGYDAYVVSGYGTREVCSVNLSYTTCPLVETDEKVYPKPITLKNCRYTVRPPRQMKSEFVLRMKMKEDAAKKAILLSKEEQDKKEREILEACPFDEMSGWRVHSWVLVLGGCRDINKPFFIEPTTGVEHSIDWDQYLGIETLWNHLNYYINSQPNIRVRKTRGPANVMKRTEALPHLLPPFKLNFDIGDSRDWEYIFPGQDLHITKTEDELKDEKVEIALRGDMCKEEMHFDLPMSWTLPLSLSRDDFDMRYPTGKKTIKYKYAIVEVFSHYLNPDGLIHKLYVYKDLAYTELFYSKERYAHRNDLLVSRFLDQATGTVIEYFDTGREDFILEHRYCGSASQPGRKRVVLFEKGNRKDELYKLEDDEGFLKLHFGDRGDRMYYKEVTFGSEGKVMEKMAPPGAKPIETITVRMHRNPAVPANEDIAEIVYTVGFDAIDILYHTEDHRIACSARHFLKPPLWWDETQVLSWSPDLHWNFESDVYVRPLDELTLYQMLLRLMAREVRLREITREYEREIRNILRSRTNEENTLELVKTYAQADRVESMRIERLKVRAQEKAYRILKKSDILRDYLEPYIHRIGFTKITNKRQAARVKDDCMADLRDRLLTQANMIKEQFDKEKKMIEYTQLWYHDNFSSISEERAENCNSFLIQRMFVAHILEQRLTHIKEYALVKYQELHDTLMRDPRLVPFLV